MSDSPSAQLPIPPVGHLVWLGPRLSPLAYLAVRAAHDRGGLDRVLLHYDDLALLDDPLVDDLRIRGVELQPAALSPLVPGLDAAPEAFVGRPAETWQRLRALYVQLGPPNLRSDLVRYHVVWQHGGIYIDTDAIALQNLTPLRADPGFAGLERICFPARVTGSVNPLRWAKAWSLRGLRAVIYRRLADPGRTFAKVEHLYPLAVNGAVMGGQPQHPLVGRMLDEASDMSVRRALVRSEIGPRLIQRLTDNRSQPDFVLHPPSAFYPLAPEICLDYVRDDPDGQLGSTLSDATYLAHLYDSVFAKRMAIKVDVPYLCRSRGRTLLARMVAPYLDDLFVAAERREPAASV